MNHHDWLYEEYKQDFELEDRDLTPKTHYNEAYSIGCSFIFFILLLVFVICFWQLGMYHP